jgi:RNA polymerase sigma-70 factor (ECF subfamily)
MTDEAARPNSSAMQFREAYDIEFAFVSRLVRRLGVRDSHCEDLVHDVFVAAFRSWSTFDSSRPVRPWLSGVTARVVLDHLRKHSTHREETRESLPELHAQGGPAEALERNQGLSRAQQIIDALEVDRRSVFVMHELEGLPVPEIAEMIGIPLNTAYSRLRLARRDFENAAQAFRAERAS